MSQVLEKIYDCKTCNKPIRIAKIDNVPPGQGKRQWDRFEPDGVTPHQCKKSEQQTQFQKSELAALQKEVTALKEQVRSLVSQIQLMRQELGGATKK